MKLSNEMKEHPFFVLFFSVLSTVIITLGTTTFATIGYVDKQYKASKDYVNEKHQGVKEDLKEIKDGILGINERILDIYTMQKENNK